MKKNQIFILAVIFIVLVAGVAVKEWIKPKELVSEEFSPLGFFFDAGLVEKIQIGRGDQTTVHLVKSGADWRLPEFANARADGSKIAAFLTSIREMKGELRAFRADQAEDFGLIPADAFRVRLWDALGTPLLEFWIGSKQSGEGYAFIRREPSEKIFVTDADYFTTLALFGNPQTQVPQNEPWVALDLLNVHLDQIEKFEIRRRFGDTWVVQSGAEQSTELSPAGGGLWQFSRPGIPFEADPEKILNFLSNLVTLRASRAQLEDPEAEKRFRPQWEMEIRIREGKSLTLQAGPRDPDTQFYKLLVSSEPLTFLVLDYHFKQMDADDSSFFAANPLRVEPEAVEKIIVKSGRNRMIVRAEEAAPEAWQDYLKRLENFTVSRMLSDPDEQKKIKSRGPHYLEIHPPEGQPVILDVGKALSKDAGEYPARLREGDQPFAISAETFRSLFENTGRSAR